MPLALPSALVSKDNQRLNLQWVKPMRGHRYAIYRRLRRIVIAVLLTFGCLAAPARSQERDAGVSDIGTVQEQSAAARAGILPGDVIVEIDGQPIERFEEVQQIVRFNQGTPLALVVERDGSRVPLTVTPEITQITDRMGNTHSIGLLGIGRAGMEYRRHDPLTAIWQAGRETVNLTVGTLGAVGQMISGSRGTEASHAASFGPTFSVSM